MKMKEHIPSIVLFFTTSLDQRIERGLNFLIYQFFVSTKNKQHIRNNTVNCILF